MHKLSTIHRSRFSADHVVTRGREGDRTWSQFLVDLSAVRGWIRGHSETDWALFEKDTYRFAVGLFALLAEDCQVFIPGEDNPAVTGELQKLGARCMGDFRAENTHPVVAGENSAGGGDFSLQGRIVVFTSGSSGRPKVIPKALRQIDAELENLESLWGGKLGDALVLSTVSHQHLYGLLFHVLWPLCAGRAFWRKRFDSPTALMAVAARNQRTAWVMSPAQLHRIDGDLPWAETRHSTVAVFSSGGPLQITAADEIDDHLGFRPHEVYGSSETGGIAWREQRTVAEPWTLFPGISARLGGRGALSIRSPYLPGDEWYETDDAAEIFDDGRFRLGSRLDRIIKVEGKRVSLPATEHALQKHPWISEACAVPVERRRQSVGALLVPTDEGNRAWEDRGHHRFGLALRHHCREYLAAAATPRYWRLADSIPRNSQGKVLRNSVQNLFRKGRYPTVLKQELIGSACRLVLFIDADLPYFEGHFPGMPILPGVTQLHWAEHFARELLGVEGQFLDMRQIKFKELVHADCELVLNLKYVPQSGCLEFLYESVGGPHGQGRMFFGVRE